MTKQNKWQKELGRIKNSKQALSFLTNVEGKEKSEICKAKSPLASAASAVRTSRAAGLILRSLGLLLLQEDGEGSA